jgi:hypothetical protein
MFVLRLVSANTASPQLATFIDDPTMRRQGTIALWNTFLFGRQSFRVHAEWTTFLGSFNLNGALLQVRLFRCAFVDCCLI